jgi:hypothetical protein
MNRATAHKGSSSSMLIHLVASRVPAIVLAGTPPVQLLQLTHNVQHPSPEVLQTVLSSDLDSSKEALTTKYEGALLLRCGGISTPGRDSLRSQSKGTSQRKCLLSKGHFIRPGSNRTHEYEFVSSCRLMCSQDAAKMCSQDFRMTAT